ncbi:AAA family ATPase [Olivibacter sp. SDN3]|uniref:ATP-dependent DNA helicase n=1 Tax=Olivibacter sp. SDN3 TaxID=2764720 RepID=UPI001651AEA2|nr:AAA family ATPase [Olivibacter sp. SDN3]QNL48437.1 AAA family ATPase [Olivibacter sp. SDN3]
MELTRALIQSFLGTPTTQQLNAFKLFEKFLVTPNDKICFILKGYAGTGKTTAISAIVKALPMINMRSVLLAPTGRAAKVMQTYAGKKATTIHKKIYRKKVAGTPEMNFSLSDNHHKNTLFIVDEASMISNEDISLDRKSLLEDLINYVEQGKDCRLMFVGDVAQLPPVGLIESPALDAAYLNRFFGYEVFSYELTDVVRQDKHSGILFNATSIREQIRLDSDCHDRLRFPKLKVGGYRDVFRMTGERLVEGLHYAYDKYGMENTLVICRSNKNANLYNQNIRNRILYREEELTGGDHVMVVRNNYYWTFESEQIQSFIANGDMAVVKRVRNVHEQHGFRFADVTLRFIDQEEQEPLSCRVLLDVLYADAPGLVQEDHRKLFEAVMRDYEYIENKKDRLAAIKTDPYYNALQIKFSMAVTCHKAQGGQWDAVFIDQGYLTDEMLDTEFLRWLYTACTRATTELFLLNFNDQFFD